MCRDQKLIAKHMGNTRSVPAVRAHITKHRKRVNQLIALANAEADAAAAEAAVASASAAGPSEPPSPSKVLQMLLLADD